MAAVWPTAPPQSSLPHQIVTANQAITVHDWRTGIAAFQFTPQEYTTLDWTLKQLDAGTCDIAVPPLQGVDPLTEIAPWASWVTVWDGDTGFALWTGPVQKVSYSRTGGLTLNVKDHSAYLQRTRTTMSKEWDNTDPVHPANELWMAMLAQKGIKATPIVIPDVHGFRYDYTSVEDTKTLDQNMSDLQDLGLVWTVAAGVPILGPISYEPVAELSEDDFIGDAITLTRDGSATYNDVLVLAEGSQTRETVEYYGQSLQTIKNFDHLSDVSNVITAAQSYVQQVGGVKTVLTLAEGTQLHPNAPVTMADLIPSKRFIIEAQGVRQKMQLTSVEVSRTAGAATVKVTMISDFELPPELTSPKKQSTSSTSSTGASA
jgi:hypothetical protein